MKKILFLSLLLAALLFIGAYSAVLAKYKDKATDCYGEVKGYCNSYNPKTKEFDFNPPDKTVCICNPLTTSKFTDVVDRILNIIFFVALAVAPVMIIVAGFKFLTGGGDPKNLTSAKQMLIWTGVGFGIILLSKGIVVILRGVIGF